MATVIVCVVVLVIALFGFTVLRLIRKDNKD